MASCSSVKEKGDDVWPAVLGRDTGTIAHQRMTAAHLGAADRKLREEIPKLPAGELQGPGTQASRAGILPANATSVDLPNGQPAPSPAELTASISFLNPAQMSLWSFPCRFCSQLAACEAPELFSIIGRAGSSVREDVLQPCKGKSRRRPLKGIQGTASLWARSRCSPPTLTCHANVMNGISGSTASPAPPLVARWVGRGWAHWKAEPWQREAPGLCTPPPPHTHSLLHTQMLVCAAAVKMEGEHPLVRTRLPHRGSAEV